MAKKKRKNLYAVYFLDGRKDNKQIYYTWEEEQRATFHIPHMMHGFETEAEAEAWFKNITREDVDTHRKIVAKKKQVKEEKKKLKKYEVYLDEEHSKAIDEFLRRHKITMSDYVKETIEKDLMADE